MGLARQEYEQWLRTTSDGLRDYSNVDNESSGALADRQGRLVTAPSTLAGFDVPVNSNTLLPGRRDWIGSAPFYGNNGLVQSLRVLQRPNAFANSGGAPWCIRMHGYVQADGWVQLILRDETGGVPNPPVGGETPEVTIAVGANQNFVFGNWPLCPGIGVFQELATYIAFSTTGPIYTPGGVNLWFAFLGGL